MKIQFVEDEVVIAEENIDFKDISKSRNITPITKDTTNKKNGLKASNNKILEEISGNLFETEMKNKWDKIFKTSDAKRFVYLVKEERTFRGKNQELDDWVKKTFK